MIEVRDLRRTFGPAVAVDGIGFDIRGGEVVGFLGPNGAGKTTTMRMLTAFLPPSSGTVRVAGFDASEAPLEVRRRIGYLPENNPLYEESEVGETLEWVAELRGIDGEARLKAVRRAVERCGLGDALGKPIGLLSKGYRQRVGLAQAILHDPPILFLDEPTSGLDPNQSRDVRDLILELKKEKTVLLSTHILSEVRAVCDRVLIIHRGRVVAQGTPDELQAGASDRARVSLVLRAGPDARAVEARLAGVAGVASASAAAAGQELRVEVRPAAGADPREALYRACAAEGWGLLELHAEAVSLEEVFQRLTA